jgi:hypothetical protein
VRTADIRIIQDSNQQQQGLQKRSMYDVRREREDRKRRNHREKESEVKVEVRTKNTSDLESTPGAGSAGLVRKGFKRPIVMVLYSGGL